MSVPGVYLLKARQILKDRGWTAVAAMEPDAVLKKAIDVLSILHEENGPVKDADNNPLMVTVETVSHQFAPLRDMVLKAIGRTGGADDTLSDDLQRELNVFDRSLREGIFRSPDNSGRKVDIHINAKDPKAFRRSVERKT